MLFDCVTNGRLVPTYSNVPFNFYAHFSDVWYDFSWCHHDKVDGLFQEAFSKGGEANFFEGVDGCNFEMEAGVFADCLR